MHRVLLVAVVAACASAPIPFDDAANHRRAEAACPRVTVPTFYRVEKGGATSYLLGTRHVGVPLAKFPRAVRDRLLDAKVAVFETPPGGDGSHDSPPTSDEAHSGDLREGLGEADWRRFVGLVGNERAEGLRDAAPAVALMYVVAAYEDLDSKLEQDLENAANDARIPTAGLESHAFQRRLIVGTFDLRLLRVLVEQASSRDLRDWSVDSLRAYCHGEESKDEGVTPETRAIMRRAGYADTEIDGIDDKLVYQRNASWVPQLVDLFTTGGAFVAVGAAHLPGPRGVVALLRARGFTVVKSLE